MKEGRSAAMRGCWRDIIEVKDGIDAAICPVWGLPTAFQPCELRRKLPPCD